MVRAAERLWEVLLSTNPKDDGFSLLELMFAMTLTLIIGTIGFQLFRQNERVFQQQNAIAETQQNVRAVVFQINDEIRKMGQEVPVYSASFDDSPGEATVAVLNGSDATHLRMREGFSNIETTTTQTASDYRLNSPQSIPVQDASLFPAGTGRFIYLWGGGANGCWSWVRAELMTTSANVLSANPRQIGDSCRTAADVIHFTTAQMVSLEECVSIYWNAGSIWRATSNDMTSPAAPLWSAVSELGREIDSLSFTYYDEDDNAVIPNSLSNRVRIVRVDLSVRASNGLTFAARGVPRNLKLR